MAHLSENTKIVDLVDKTLGSKTQWVRSTVADPNLEFLRFENRDSQ